MSEHLRGCPLFTHPSQRGPDHPTDCRCESMHAHDWTWQWFGLDPNTGHLIGLRSCDCGVLDSLQATTEFQRTRRAEREAQEERKREYARAYRARKQETTDD